MKKRIVRLFASLWPYLIIILLLYSSIGVDYSKIYASMNFIGLGWFAKLPYIGHLWFVTMIIVCYIMYTATINLEVVKRINSKKYLLYLFFIVSLLFQVIVDYLGQPGYFFMILFYSLWFFIYANRFMVWVKKMKTYWVWVVFVICNSLAIYSNCESDGVFALSFQRLACNLSGLSWLIVLLKNSRNVEPYSWFMFLAIYGYEIYLVHHALCCGKLSVIHSTNYVVLNYLILWMVTCLLAYILKLIGENFSKRIIKMI